MTCTQRIPIKIQDTLVLYPLSIKTDRQLLSKLRISVSESFVVWSTSSHRPNILNNSFLCQFSWHFNPSKHRLSINEFVQQIPVITTAHVLIGKAYSSNWSSHSFHIEQFKRIQWMSKIFTKQWKKNRWKLNCQCMESRNAWNKARDFSCQTMKIPFP